MMTERQTFLQSMYRMAEPVLTAAASGSLRKTMTLRQAPGADREAFMTLETVARLLNGMAPWLESTIADPEEEKMQLRFRELAREAIARLADPSSPDYGGFSTLVFPNSQTLVDAAFLAQAILRAPDELWKKLSSGVQEQLLDGFRSVRGIRPGLSNWLLFSAEIELFMERFGLPYYRQTLEQTKNLFESWYVGDGWYKDGPYFAMDYYNSIVIHPFLLDLAEYHGGCTEEYRRTVRKRALRHSEQLERLIVDGCFPAVGRSLCYRGGVFHLPAYMSARKMLPEELSGRWKTHLLQMAGQLDFDGNYREDGFLTIGLHGRQPSIGEGYITTASLYLASLMFLPLGISGEDEYWQRPGLPGTYERVWRRGEDVPCDHKMI